MKHIWPIEPVIRLAQSLLSYFRPGPARVAEVQAPARRSNKKDHEAFAGEFYFRESILDQFDMYFDCIKRMRRSDPDAYALYSKLGAHLIPKEMMTSADKLLSPWFLQARPTFGAVAFGVGYSVYGKGFGDTITPKFLYFTKFKKDRLPARFQRINCPDIYIVTAYWDEPRKDKYKPIQLVCDFAIAVDDAGRLSPIKSLDLSPATVRGRSGSGRGRTFQIPQRNWKIPSFCRHWAAEQKVPLNQFLVNLFCLVANQFEAVNSALTRIDVESNNQHAVFSVDIKRTPYFFKDRDITINMNGSKQRIFHIVRPHERVTRAGATRSVKMHFRGLRKFSWNGYQVVITVPGLHHSPLTDFDVPARLDQGLEPMVGSEYVAGMLREKVLEHGR